VVGFTISSLLSSFGPVEFNKAVSDSTTDDIPIIEEKAIEDIIKILDHVDSRTKTQADSSNPKYQSMVHLPGAALAELCIPSFSFGSTWSLSMDCLFIGFSSAVFLRFADTSTHDCIMIQHLDLIALILDASPSNVFPFRLPIRLILRSRGNVV
jgi:hypothetical protein